MVATGHDCVLHIYLFHVPSISLQMATFFFVMWGASAVVFLFSDQFGISSYTHPLALSCFFLIFAINTLNVWFRHARFWLLKALVSSTSLSCISHLANPFVWFYTCLNYHGNFNHEIHVAYTKLFSWQNCFANMFWIYFSVESVDCAIPPCSICRLLARRSVEQPGCCHTWHGVFVLFLCTWFLLCSRWDQVASAEFCFYSACTQHSFAFAVLGMSQTCWQMKLIRLKCCTKNI